jgi:hypothetical protein
MADVAWPSTLPLWQFGASEKPGDLITFSVGEWARPLMRKRVTRKSVVTSISFVFTAAQMDTFKNFWNGALAYGANNIVVGNPQVGWGAFQVNAWQASMIGQGYNTRFTPVDTYEAVAVAPNVYQVTIPVRREIS